MEFYEYRTIAKVVRCTREPYLKRELSLNRDGLCLICNGCNDCNGSDACIKCINDNHRSFKDDASLIEFAKDAEWERLKELR